jgi:hypothetical protein
LALGVGLGYWFVQSSEWELVVQYLRNVLIWPLLLAGVIINLTMLFRSLRWQVLLAPIARVSLHNAFAATSIGFGSVFIIGRTGEIIRPIALSLREKLPPSATFATILIERVYDTTAVVLLFAFNLLFFQPPAQNTISPQALTSIRSLGLLLSLGVVSGLVILALLRVKADVLLDWLQRITARLPARLVQPLLNLARHLADGLSVLASWRALGLSILHTVMVWSLVTFASWLVLYAFRQSFSLSQVIFVLGFGLVGSIVPTPGGSAGAFHATAAKGFVFLGLDHNLAAAIAIIYHLIAFGPPFIVGLYYLIRDEISLSQLREMLRQETTAHASEPSR